MNNEPKTGLRSTEFWLASVAALFSVLWGAGVIDPEGAGNANRIAGFVATGLAALGYGISRGLAKMNAVKITQVTPVASPVKAGAKKK